MERDPQTYAIIGTALEVHNILGPGHLEAVYQEALEIEFDLRHIPYESKPRISLEYKGRRLKKYYEPDFLVYERVSWRSRRSRPSAVSTTLRSSTVSNAARRRWGF